MHKGIFVTGTGTDIGKTFVTALLTNKLHDASCAAAYVKIISEISQPIDSMCPYIRPVR